MKALEYLINLRDTPRQYKIFLPKDPTCGKDTIINPSNGALRRWLNDGGVLINDSCPKATDEMVFPVTSLVFFPKGKRKTTLL